MILVDTSVWIDHFKQQNTVLAGLVIKKTLRCHPIVVGELSVGSLPIRLPTLAFLNKLPMLIEVDHDGVQKLVERFKIYGKGIGYADAQLLASVKLTEGCQLWTKDKRLEAVAAKIVPIFKPYH